MVRRYVPEAGDIVWLDFDPQAGHEHAGHRPALVVSPQAYNGKTRLMLCCPMTTQIKGYPFEVRISGKRPGVVLAVVPSEVPRRFPQFFLILPYARHMVTELSSNEVSHEAHSNPQK